MKKYTRILIGAISLLSLTLSSQYSYAAGCDEVFQGSLRAGSTVRFNDEMTNTTPNPVFVNQIIATFAPAYNYSTNPTWTESSLVSSSHVWSPGESGPLIESSNYTIGSHPPVRSFSNLQIQYNVIFSEQIGGEWGAGQSHVECKNYEITWCGDGIRDAGDGEECDKTDGVGPGKMCDSTCKLVDTTPAPKCDALGMLPPKGRAPLSVNAGCAATNASSVSISCGNGTSVNGKEGVCMYNTPGTYTASCTVNGNITSPACTQTVTVDSSELPACIPGPTTGVQSEPFTATVFGLCPTGQSVTGFTGTSEGNANTYMWGCNGSKVGGNCTVTTTTIIPPECGDGTRNGTEACDPTDATKSGWGNGGCDNQCKPINLTIPLCSTTVFGQLSSEINAGSCDSGTPKNFTKNGTNPINYSWNCTNGTTDSPLCTANYTPQPTSCVPGPTTGAQPNELVAGSTGLCQPGVSVGNFNPTTNGSTTNYSWSCGNSTVGGACVASYTPVVIPSCVPGPTVGTQPNPLTVASPGLCPSGVSVGNFTGSTGALNVTYTWSCGTSLTGGSCTAAYQLPVVPNTFDLSIKKYINGADAQNSALAATIPTNTAFTYTLVVRNEGPATATGVTTITDTLPLGTTLVSVANTSPWTCSSNIGSNSFSCSTSAPIPSGTTLSNITVNATTTTSTGILTNIGIVSNPGDTNPANNTDPAVINVQGIVVPPTGPTCGSLSVNPTGTVNPNITVTYTCGASGYTGSVANLEYNIKCTTTDTTNTWGSGTTRNCTAPSTNSTSQTASCSIRDRTNPSVVFSGSDAGSCRSTLTTTGSTTTGGDEVVGKKCVNGIPTCASYKTKKACTDEGITDALCYGNDSVGQAMCSNQSLSCSTTTTTGSTCTDPNGCSTSVSGYCGDGVLQPGAGEQCDVRGATWCDRCCMIIADPWTNPGENPITSMWIRIPALTNTNASNRHIGDGSFLKIPLDLDGTTPDAYKVVVGQNTNVFTLADQLYYGLTTKYLTPIIVDADKMMCLQAHGNNLSSNDGVCTTFRQSGARITRISGTDYVVFGGGTYQERLANGTYANVNILNPVKEVLLFKGSSKYNLISTPSTTESLRNVFKGVNTIISGPQNGGITLFGCDGNNCGPTAITTLVNIPVRVSAAVVASIGSSANRSLEQFLSQATSPFAAFLGGTSININTSTTTNNTVNNTTTVTIPVLPAKSGDDFVKSVTDLEKYTVNGNKNVLSINGNLTIEGCLANTFVMDGVRTVVVTGNLIIKCNIVYGSNDANSSWAWITKGGNIVVSNGVRTTASLPITNLAGVYVSILDNSNGGKITYEGDNTTQAILKIDGSMYGDASPLFGSRLYARANGAYDILTTGTILSYSNRALVSPPPLLSQYLGAYKVVRVVQ